MAVRKASLNEDVLSVTVQQEEIQKAETMAVLESSTAVLNMRTLVDQKTKEIAVLADFQKNQTAEIIIGNISKMDNIIFDDAVMERVAKSITTARDFNEFVKARAQLHELLMKQTQFSADPEKHNTSMSHKIELLFKDGTVIG